MIIIGASLDGQGCILVELERATENSLEPGVTYVDARLEPNLLACVQFFEACRAVGVPYGDERDVH